MLDIKFIRDNAKKMQKVAKQKNIDIDIKELLKLDDWRKEYLQKIESIKAKKNEASKNIPKLNKEEKAKILSLMKEIDIEQKQIQEQLVPIEKQFIDLMMQVPMNMDERTPIGKDDRNNEEIEKVGEIPQFDFALKSHEELVKDLDLADFEAAAKISGSRAYILKGDLARLEVALIKYAEDFITRRGYTLMSVPVIVNKSGLEGTGHLPGGEDEIYHLEKDDKYLVGTSEVSIAGYHSDEILNEAELPKRYAGFSVCFRREAGSYGKDTHGLYRVHQFLKVEQFIFCKNDNEESKRLHEELLKNAKDLLVSLNLPFRVLNVCSGDMGRGKYYMNDIETWMPSRAKYGETHSCSTLHDFQARRLNIRYRDNQGKVKFCHTLNNTVAATPRLLIPILELNQNRDGSINIPDVLQSYMGGQKVIKKKNV